MFTSPSYKVSIEENATINTEVLTVIAFNGLGDPMMYEIIYMGIDFPFEIEPTTGVIKVSNLLDYDENSNYEFTIQASVSGYYTSVPTTIQVIDVPDPQPISCYPKTHWLVLEESANLGNTSQWLNCSLPNKPDDKLLYIAQDGPISVDSYGFIILNEKLDYENQTQLNITITFADLESNLINGATFIVIKVLPFNEHGPVFNEDEYIFTLQENEDIGFLVGMVTAYDDDLGLDGIIHYQLIGGNGTEMFILSNTGKLYTSAQIDYEEYQLFELIIEGFDTPLNSSLRLTNITYVYIYINDTNDNIPKFIKDVYFAEISEASVPPVAVLNVECIDLDTDLNSMIDYAIVNSSNGLFSINESSGLITLDEFVDFEILTLYQFWVMCLDHGIPSLSSEVLVIIAVLGANEYDPYFNNTAMNFSVVENSAIGSIIGQLEADDDDIGKAGDITFELIHSLSCPSIVEVIKETGSLVLVGELDYELFIDPVIYCSVRVWDNQEPQRMTEGMVKITISNINDCSPLCDPGITVVTVSESMSTGSDILVLHCTDPDTNYLDYNIINNTHDQFEIQAKPDGPVLTLASKLDYETTTSHIIHISVSDTMYSTLLVIYLIITPANEHYPVFSEDVYNCSINETSSIGDRVCTVLAEDMDEGKDGQVFYYLKNEDKFIIDKLTGELYLSQTFDYEETQLYQLTVYAHDLSLTDQLSSSSIINITVEDSNDNAPYISQYMFSNVAENAAIGTVLSSINCTDIDSSQNGYTVLEIKSVTAFSQDGSITELTDYPFVLDNDTGIVLVSGDIDFESTAFYKLLIECADGGIFQLKSTSTVMITVNGINEHSPIFPYKLLEMTLTTKDKVGSILFLFTAFDNDIGDSITYTMSNKHPTNLPNTSHFLAIETLSGILLITAPVKCSYGSKYIYIVKATDSGEPYSLSDTLEAHFTIEDCGNSPPLAKSNIYTASVLENSDNGSVVVNVNCSIAEYVTLPDGAVIYYNITDNLANKVFNIGHENGDIVTKIGLDYEYQSSHVIPVSCYYSHSPYQTTDIIVYLQVLPVNEHTPVFTDNEILNITENTSPGTKIADVRAVDNDKDEDGDVRYFISNSSEFVVDSQTGEIYLLTNLDRERNDSYKVTILAYDNPLNISNKRTGSTVLHIVISDTNDNYPYCDTIVQYINLPVTTTVGTAIARINCSDIDENSTIHYHISNIWLVDVDSITGIVYLLSVINETFPLYHTIPITISDDGVPPLITTIYLSISLDLSGDVLLEEEKIAVEREREGWLNNVTVTIENMYLEQVCISILYIYVDY